MYSNQFHFGGQNEKMIISIDDWDFTETRLNLSFRPRKKIRASPLPTAFFFFLFPGSDYGTFSP